MAVDGAVADSPFYMQKGQTLYTRGLYRGKLKKEDKQIRVAATDGTPYYVPEGFDINQLYVNMRLDNEFSEYYKSLGRRGSAVQTAGDYIDFVFKKSKSEKLEQECNGGHIQKLMYSKRYMMLKVTFANNGSEVVYLEVPFGIYKELATYAESGACIRDATGKVRHLVGIKLWDYVRKRGTIHGGQYYFVYTQGGDRGRGFKGYGYSSNVEHHMRETGEVVYHNTKTHKEMSSEEYQKFKEMARDPKAAEEWVQVPLRELREEFQRRDLDEEEGGLNAARIRASSLGRTPGTIAYTLSDPNLDVDERLDKAMDMAKKMVDYVLPRLQPEHQMEFLREGIYRADVDSQVDPILRQERWLAMRGMWPIPT